MKRILPSLTLTAFALITFVLTAAARQQQQQIPIWPAPATPDTAKEKVRIAETGDHVISNIQHPSVTYYPADPKKATGAAIVIAPGGGHV